MPHKATFLSRLVADTDFYEKTLKTHTRNNPDDRPPLLTKLMYIHANSKEHRRQHNVMSKRVFDKILAENPSMSIPLLKASFHSIEEPAIEPIESEVERTIKYAIALASESPFRSIILTAPEKEREYLENSHYKDVKEISVKAGEEAIATINSLWDACSEW